MKFITLFLFLGIKTVSAGNIKTITTPAGMTCTQAGDAKSECTFAPEFNENFKAAFGSGFTFMAPRNASASGEPVCEEMAPYIPSSNCTCEDTEAGGTAVCNVDLNGLDTVVMEVDMNVCADPLAIVFTLTDGDTGLVFTYSVSAGDVGEVPTGIIVGIPDVGDAEIYLTYELYGNIDELTMVFGFDLGVTVFGFTTYCSSIYPDECPLTFLNETIAFSDSC